LTDTLVSRISTGSRQLLYGRTNGSGKSQQLFALMACLYNKKIPFVFREVFWFHYQAWQKNPNPEMARFERYSQLEREGEAPTRWLLEVAEEVKKKSGKTPVLILDEEDCDLDQLSGYSIIAADKVLTRYTGDWVIYDLIRDWSPSSEEIAEVLTRETASLGLHLSGQLETIEAAAASPRIPFYHGEYLSAYQAKLLLTLAALEAVKRVEKGEGLRLDPADVMEWQHKTHLLPPPISDDFHCEYIIYDGEGLEWDPLTKFESARLVLKHEEG